MIDSVPWAARGKVRAPAEPREASEPDKPTARIIIEDLDGDDGVQLTISRAQQEELRQQLAEPTSAAGPPVHAVRCTGGHLNPPNADACRICSTPIEEQSPITLPRPVLGLLRFSTGDVITLDRNVVIGRTPTTDRTVGTDRPHLVRLASFEKDISRNHVEVRLDDWHVLVTDLNSTNGTMVNRPGRDPERLRPNQPAMIEPGTTVTIADVVTFEFESTE